jgi:hypothetical protein
VPDTEVLYPFRSVPFRHLTSLWIYTDNSDWPPSFVHTSAVINVNHKHIPYKEHCDTLTPRQVLTVTYTSRVSPTVTW